MLYGRGDGILGMFCNYPLRVLLKLVVRGWLPEFCSAAEIPSNRIHILRYKSSLSLATI